MNHYTKHSIYAHRNATYWSYYKITGIGHSKENPATIYQDGHFDFLEVVKIEKELEEGTEIWREVALPFEVQKSYLAELVERKEVIFKN